MGSDLTVVKERNCAEDVYVLLFKACDSVCERSRHGEGLQRRLWGGNLRNQTSWEGMTQPARTTPTDWWGCYNCPDRGALMLLLNLEWMIINFHPISLPTDTVGNRYSSGLQTRKKCVQPKTFWRARGLFTGQVWSQQKKQVLCC